MTDQTTAAPGAAEPTAITADDLALIDPQLADTIKDEAEIWSEIQATKATDGKPAATPAAETARGQEPEPASDTGTRPETTPAPAAADIWASATPEQRTAYEALQAEAAEKEKRLRSSYGRVSALQRKINAALAQPSRDTNVRDEIAGIQDDYPEIAQPLSKALEKIDTRFNEMSKAGQSEVEAAQSELNGIIEAETQRLMARHPDYVDVLKKNGKAFAEWIEDQPRAIREAAYRNAKDIADSDGAIEVVQRFKQHLGLASAPQQVQQPAPQPQLDDRRQRQIAASSSPQRTGGRPTVSGIPAEGDEEAIWKAIQAEKAMRRA